MSVERAGGRELAELVTDHVLAHQNGDMLVTVVDAERQADELRQDRRAAAPDLDDFVTARTTRGFCLLEQITIDKRTFGERARHLFTPSSCSCDAKSR